jgi:hypothetical protein
VFPVAFRGFRERLMGERLHGVWACQAADIDGLIADEEDEFEPAAAFVERHAPSKVQRRQESEHGHSC